ncbi:MAG TPA: CHAT domain-containing protein [Gemmatimonadaceae bacterium]|nr:CHAT domain-containing protein [Gemmatimonadaceae bacterium]
MLSSLTVLALALSLGAATDTAADPRAVVSEAVRAVEVDSAAALRARWTARLARDGGDRAAALGLATLARLGYDFPDAERRYRRLFADSARADRYAVYARLGLAQGKDAEGRPAEIAALLRRASADARALGDSAAEARALVELAVQVAYTTSYDAAAAYLDSARRVLPRGATDVEAAWRCRHVQVLVITRGEGGAELASATEFARRSGEKAAEAVCLRVRAVELQLREQVDSAIAVVGELEALRRRMRDRGGLATALAVHADYARMQGDYGEAIRLFRAALPEAEASHNLFIQATVTLGLGAIALSLNDHATAAANIERAVAAFEAAGDSGSVMLARGFRPFVSLAAGDYARARREVGEVIGWARQVGDWQHVLELDRQLAAIEMRDGDWAAAERALADARSASRRHDPPIRPSELDYDLGRLALHRGDLAAAGRAFSHYLAALDTTERLLRYEARARLAEVHARSGDLDRAERELRLAGDELDSWRAGLADEKLRVLAFQASAFEANDRNASVAAVLAALAAHGRATAAFDLAERRRARELADRLARARALQARSVGAAGDRRPPRGAATLAAAEVARLIPDDRTAVVEYVTGVMGMPTTLLVITRRRPPRAAVLAPADSLVRQVARLVALLEAGDDPGPLARALGDALLAPALAAAGAGVTRLVIIPDGPLHRVPWDALRLADGRYAAERYAIGIAPSASVVATLWRERAARPPGGVRLLALGDPAFAPAGDAPRYAARDGAADGALSDGDELYRSAFESAGGLPRLEASAREARLVAGYAPRAEVRLREDASAAWLKHAALARFRVLHFATHALVDERSAARTALALAPGEGESGVITPSDLAALQLDADRVVLSACRTAGGVVVDGEGVEGLTAPLLEAGARAVVATGWRIRDRATVRFVRDFYDALASGRPVGDALREAKLSAIRRGAPPSEWAAFAAIGDPTVTVPLLRPSVLRRADPRLLLALAAGALVPLLAYSLRTRRGRSGDAS